MKFYLIPMLSIIFALNSCGQDIVTTSSETIGAYNVNNPNFYINISKVNGGATSSNFMQVRRVYNDSTYMIVKNIQNRDSVVMFSYKQDSVNLIVRGRLAAEYIENDTIRFSINDTFISERRKVKN